MSLKSFLLFVFIFLCSCKGESPQEPSKKAYSDTNDDTINTGTHTKKMSELYSFMSESHICEVIDQQKLIKIFNIKTKLNTSAHETNGNFSCDYFWEFPDHVVYSRLQLMSEMRNSGQTNESLFRRLSYGSGQLGITLIRSKRKANNFIPPKLSKQEQKSYIKQAKATARKRQINDRNALGPEAVEKAINGMIDENYQNLIIEDLGEAAYWSPIRDGTLNVYINGIEIIIMPMIADTKEEDLDNASKIYHLLNQ